MKTKKEKTRICSFIAVFWMLCLLAMQFTPFWQYGGNSISINNFVWIDSENTDLVNHLNSIINENITLDYMLNTVGGTACWQFVLCLAGIILALINPNAGIFALAPLVNGIFGTYNYIKNPILQAGHLWQLHLIINVIMIIHAVVTMFFWLKKDKIEISENRELTSDELKERIKKIKSIDLESDKLSTDEKNANLNKLLAIVDDKNPESKIAACEALAKTASDVAFTKVSHCLKYENNEAVISVMRSTLANIRENMQKEHAEKA